MRHRGLLISTKLTHSLTSPVSTSGHERGPDLHATSHTNWGNWGNLALTLGGVGTPLPWNSLRAVKVAHVHDLSCISSVSLTPDPGLDLDGLKAAGEPKESPESVDYRPQTIMKTLRTCLKAPADCFPVDCRRHVHSGLERDIVEWSPKDAPTLHPNNPSPHRDAKPPDAPSAILSTVHTQSPRAPPLQLPCSTLAHSHVKSLPPTLAFELDP